jgi:hypothetical protein
MQWVRPILMIDRNSDALSSKPSFRAEIAGISLSSSILYAAICMALENVSFDD